MAGLLFVLVFLVFFSTLSAMPMLKTLTFEDLLRKYGMWLSLQTLAFYILADVLGPSASKLIQNVVAIFIGFMILSASAQDVTLERVLANWQNSWPIYAAPIGWGIYWVTAFQRDRIKAEKQRLEKESSNNIATGQARSANSQLEELIVYRVPIIYYFVVVFWDILLGFGLSLASYFLAH